MSENQGLLYVVATPIGNLADITLRAQQVLAEVDFIAAEDTRRTRPLLNHLGIDKVLVSVHEYNERQRVDPLLNRILQGQNMALVSDAGTPLISDPGYHIVRRARELGIRIVPVPGPSALITALSISGLPTDHFRFEGFLPSRREARRRHLESLRHESVTLVFYESSHRIAETVEVLCDVFGESRQAILARELTKLYETVLGNTLGEIRSHLQGDPNQSRGEFVVVVRGAAADSNTDTERADALLQLLLQEMSVKSASRIVATYLQISKNDVYQRALRLQQDRQS